MQTVVSIMKTFCTALWQDSMCSWLGWSFGANFWISFISRGSFVILCMGAERRDWRVWFASISSVFRCLWKFSLVFLGRVLGKRSERGAGVKSLLETDEGRKEKGRIEEERKRKRQLHGDTNVWLTHSSLVLPGDVSGLHSSVHSTQTCSQPTIGGSKLNYSMYKDSLSIKYTPTSLLDECRAL